MITKAFCKRLRFARLKRTCDMMITIDKILGFPRGSIRSWEKGEAEPTSSQLSILADYYMKDYRWFLEEEKPKDEIMLWCGRK